MKENLYGTKSADIIKDIDTEKKQVAVYLSKFGVLDSDGDVVMRGAFKKSLQERGVGTDTNRKIQFLRHHDWQMQIGKWLTLEEDEKGLFGVGQLGNSTMANDAWEDYKMEIIREHSIGYSYIKDKTKFVQDATLKNGGYYALHEVILYEGSAVTFGANEETNVVEVIKSAEEKQDRLSKLEQKMHNILRSLHTGTYSDERGYQLEMALKQVTNEIILLSKTESFDIKHSIIEEPKPSFNWNEVVNMFNQN